MKKIKFWLVSFGIGLLMSSCSPFFGVFSTDSRVPTVLTNAVLVEGEITSVGEATCVSYVGLVASGDCSVETAKNNGGITNIVIIDARIENILGGLIYSKYTTIVKGN